MELHEAARRLIDADPDAFGAFLDSLAPAAIVPEVGESLMQRARRYAQELGRVDGAIGICRDFLTARGGKAAHA